MMTDTEVAIQNARQHLDGCEARLRDAARAQAEAQQALAAFPPVEAGRAARIKLAVLEAEARVEETEARWQDCRAVHTAARAQWTTLIRRAYVGRHRTRLQAAESAAQTLMAGLAEDLADREALARTLGGVDSGGHPHGDAVRLVQALAYYRRALDPPPPAPLPPPRPGTARMRCVKTFHDPDGGLGILRRPGDVFDAREECVRELRAQELAEPVEA